MIGWVIFDYNVAQFKISLFYCFILYTIVISFITTCFRAIEPVVCFVSITQD